MSRAGRGGRRRTGSIARPAGAFLAAALAGGCAWPSILAPAGPAAAEIADLWWILFAVTATGATVVIAGLLWAVRRARRAARLAEGEPVGAGGEAGLAGERGEAEAPLPGRERATILVLGAAVPTLALALFTVLAVRTGMSVSSPGGEPELVVEVTGHQFWWEVRYPEQGVVTANEIPIPAGRPVEFRVTSADVIHSFWVPRLAGKLDMSPGRTNRLRAVADEPGLYRGQCTEFCGVQHALMSLLVVAREPAEFDAWMARRRAAPRPPLDSAALRGRGVFFEAGCSSCHAIRGVNEPDYTGDVGPDLTDLAGRRTLGALTLRNTRGNLAGWILDPHQFKPGVRMPPTVLSGPEMQALLAYLETLR